MTHTTEPTNAPVPKLFLHNLLELQYVSIYFDHPQGVTEHHQTAYT